MDIVTQKQRYMPHEISTRVSAVKAYRETRSIQYVCRKYHVSKKPGIQLTEENAQ